MRIMLRFLIVLTLLSATLVAQSPLEIVAAYWGNGNNFADVTARVRSMVQGNSLNIPVNVGNLGVDPLPGAGKVLRVYYRQNGQFNQGEWREGLAAQIAPGAGGVAGGVPGNLGRIFNGNRTAAVLPLRVTFAAYGYGNQVQDVTSLMQSRIANNRLDLQITNANMGGDPAPNVVKQFRIDYEWAGRANEVNLNENDVLHLPDANGAPPMNTIPPGLRIVKAQYGMVEGNRLADVTNLLQSRITGDRLMIPVDNNSMGGDPARGADKTLYIVYEMNGQHMEKKVPEGQQLALP